MGHHIHLEEEYKLLADRLNSNSVGLPYPKTEKSRNAWKNILEMLYTPSEAEIGSQIPMLPSTLETISKRVGIESEKLSLKLDNMAKKGVILDLVEPNTGIKKYVLAPPIIGFFEFSLMRAKDTIPKKEMAHALNDYCVSDPTFVTEAFSGDTVLGRALINGEMLVEEELSSVESWHAADRLIDNAKIIALSLCYCRHKAHHLGKKCNATMENCLSLDLGAEFVIRHKFGEQITKEQAKTILAEAREAGLVQVIDNVQEEPSYICNCCGCCCGQLRAINEFNLDAVNPAPYYPVVDEGQCVSCGLCVKACHIDAITMESFNLSDDVVKKFPKFDLELCIGCGVCAFKCKQKKAIKMRANPSPSHIPRNSIEKILRMTIEKGKLGDLLFDQGSKRGIRFLNKFLKGLLNLSPAQKIMANEQVKSLFIDYMLKKIKI